MREGNRKGGRGGEERKEWEREREGEKGEWGREGEEGERGRGGMEGGGWWKSIGTSQNQVLFRFCAPICHAVSAQLLLLTCGLMYHT